MKKIDSKKVRNIVIIFILIIICCWLFLQKDSGGIFLSAPAVIIETPQKISVNEKDPIVLDMDITSLKEGNYPAASFSIGFDSSKLEFLGVEEGNVVIKSADSSSGTALPEWSVNVERSNETGEINIMYLDMTGGKYAFTDDLLTGSDNVILRLKFRLRGSVRSGDILNLMINDAVFAAIDEEKSLASLKNTLKTVDGKVVIGD